MGKLNWKFNVISGAFVFFSSILCTLLVKQISEDTMKLGAGIFAIPFQIDFK